jgi:hypothetical protein
MLSTVLVSRSLIDGAKINKIQEEANMLNNSIGIFYNTYGCLPGDCATTMIDFALPATCTNAVAAGSETYNSFNTGSIHSLTKRTCMMISLKLAGYITDVSLLPANFTESVAGSNIPRSVFSKDAAWDIIKVANTGAAIGATIPETGRIPMPIEAGVTGATANFIGKHSLLLRNASTTAGTLLTIAPTVASLATGTSATYGVSARLTQKLDLKFDDGKPYSGNIIGALNLADWAATAITSSCNSLTSVATAKTFASILPAVTYLNSNNVKNGCIVAFLADTSTFI